MNAKHTPMPKCSRAALCAQAAKLESSAKAEAAQVVLMLPIGVDCSASEKWIRDQREQARKLRQLAAMPLRERRAVLRGEA